MVCCVLFVGGVGKGSAILDGFGRERESCHKFLQRSFEVQRIERRKERALCMLVVVCLYSQMHLLNIGASLF